PRSRRAGLRRRRSADDGGHGDYTREIREVAGNDQRGALLGQLAELAQVLLADTQLHGFDSSALAERAADLAQALGGRGGHRENCRRLAVRLVDLLLLARLGSLDHALLVAFRLIDLGVSVALGGQHDGALLTLRAHLLF